MSILLATGDKEEDPDVKSSCDAGRISMLEKELSIVRTRNAFLEDELVRQAGAANKSQEWKEWGQKAIEITSAMQKHLQEMPRI